MNRTETEILRAQLAAVTRERDHAQELVARAIDNAHFSRPQSYRWAQVMHAFAVGSTRAQEMCRAAGLDPDDVVGAEPEDEEVDDAG